MSEDGTDRLCHLLYGRSPEPSDYIGGSNARMLHDAVQEIEILQKWVDDLQSGLYINCVYCGHQYGPKEVVGASMQQALYDHIAVCPKHPLSKALARIKALEEKLEKVCGNS